MSGDGGGILPTIGGVAESFGTRKAEQQKIGLQREELGLKRNELDLQRELAQFQKLAGIRSLQDIEKEQARKKGWANARALINSAYGIKQTSSAPQETGSEKLANALVAQILASSQPKQGAA